MGANSGKFFDVDNTKRFFSDMNDGMEAFKVSAVTHMEKLTSFSIMDCWRGVDAMIAKKLIGNYEYELLSQILDVQTNLADVENSILEKFRVEVDNSPNARIDYDTLVLINDTFRDKHNMFHSVAVDAENKVVSLQSRFSRYGTISTPSFSDGENAFTQLCGEDDGFIDYCINKFLTFDQEALGIIQEKGILSDVEMINNKLTSTFTKAERIITNMSQLHNRYGYVLGDITQRPGWNEFEEGIVNAFVADFENGRNGIMNFFRSIANGDYTFKDGWDDFWHASKLTLQEVADWYSNQKRHDIGYLAKHGFIDANGKVIEHWEDTSSLFGFWKKSCKENEAVQYMLSKMDFVYMDDGTYHVDVHAFKVDEIEEGVSGLLEYILEEDYSKQVHSASEAACEFLGVDDSFCWQQFGGYMDLYDDVFDIATDMEKKKYVVTVDGQAYTFWFWKGDYLNLGLGGECGFYEGNGNKDFVVKCATDHELKMSMEVNYDGNSTYDYAPSYNGEETWWITSFNPNGEEFLNGKEFKASDMVIRYDIDLTEDMDIYYAWEEQCVTSDEKLPFEFESGHVIYVFDGEGD